MKRFFGPPRIFGVIDHPVDGQTVDGAVQVRGWVMTRIGQQVDLEIVVDGKTVKTNLNRTPREDVREVHAKYARHNPTPGYLAELSLHSLAPGRHTLAVRATGRRDRKILAQVEIAVPNELERESGKDELYWRTADLLAHRARLLCIHIPKTAGTSLNAYLSEHYKPERTYLHAENELLGKARYEVENLDRFDLISGHVPLDIFEQFLVPSRFFSVTVLRDPIRQLASHFAWVKRLAHPKRLVELARSPDHIKRAVERLDRLDLVAFIDTMTPEEQYLFDNCQVRYFLPRGTLAVDETQLPEALARLAGVDLVGTTDRLYDFLLLLAYEMGWPPPQRAPRLNTGETPDFIDPETTDPSLQTRFNRLTRLDAVVYRQAGRMFEARLRGAAKILAHNGAFLDPATGLTSARLADAIVAFQESGDRFRGGAEGPPRP